jgi:HNH endonuclease
MARKIKSRGVAKARRICLGYIKKHNIPIESRGPCASNKAILTAFEVLVKFDRNEPRAVRLTKCAEYCIQKDPDPSYMRKAARTPFVPSVTVSVDVAWVTSGEFLKSYEWRTLRYQALKESNGRCQCCGARPTLDSSLHVDHIKPRRKYPELALVLTNLQVLCEECNHGKGNRDETDWRKTA